MKVFSVLLLLVLPVTVLAQSGTSVQRQELEKLDFLIGEWKGRGWFMRADGKNFELTHRAKVKRKPDDLALRIEGEVKFKESAAPFEPNQFSLFPTNATVFYDEQVKQYRWRRESARGSKSSDDAALIEPKTLQLVRAIARTRHTIRIAENGEWHETFEVWVDGNWRKFLETTLQRIK